MAPLHIVCFVVGAGAGIWLSWRPRISGKLAILFAFLPYLGMGLGWLLGREHVVSEVGRCFFMLGMPLGLICSFRAFSRASDHGFAFAALALSTIAWTLTLLALMTTFLMS